MSSRVALHLGRSWWVFLGFGLIAIAFGLVAILRPGPTIWALAWAMGVMALAEGLVALSALFARDMPVSKAWLAAYALASLLFGLAAVFFPTVVADALLIVLSAWLLVAGVFRIYHAIRLREVLQDEWLLVISGVLALALGVLFLLFPGPALMALALWLGAGALVYGVLQAWLGLHLRKLRRP